MTLDNLKPALDEIGRRLDASETADRAQLVQTSLRRSRSDLGPLQWSLWLEVTWSGGATGFFVWYIAMQAGSPWSAVASAGLLLVLNALYLIATVRQLVQLDRLDLTAPVVDVQRGLATLHALRSRVVRNVLLASPLVWLTVLVVGVEWALGVDVIAAASPRWFVSNLAFGVAVLGGGLWVAHRRPEWVEKSPWLRRMADHLAGRSLRRAKEHAEEAAAFERDLKA
jgi:hypothetical protein